MKISNQYFNCFPIFSVAKSVVTQLKDAGFKAFFVGGAVRDMLLGKPPKDIDIATNATPEQTVALFKRCHQVGVSFGVIVVTVKDFNFEIATFREEREYADGRHPQIITYTGDPYLDAARRDFTINAMFYDPDTTEILDFFNGRADLENGILRCVGDSMTRFNEDHLRMLRAVRFATRFNFRIDPPMCDAVIQLKDKITKISAERIRDELNAMLTGPRPSTAIRMLEQLGLLQLILPEVSALRGVEQPPQYHPEGDVFTHTMLMLDHMKYPSVALAWSVLLHDIGKPRMYSVGPDNIIHFYKHESAGARIAEKIMQRFKFSIATTEAVIHAVKNHMRISSAHLMRKSKLARLMAHPNFKAELELHRLDSQCSNKQMNNYLFLLDKVTERGGSIELPPPLLNGHDLIAIGFKPGPKIGKTLHKIEDLRLEGKISDRQTALDVVQKLRRKN